MSSDKATLHVFDLPRFSIAHKETHSTDRSHRYPNTTPTPLNGEDGKKHKWGILGRIPLLPRVFSDVYSFASANFETNDDPRIGFGVGGPIPIPGLPGGKARKGIIGWTNNSTIVVIGAGRDGRWERFILVEDEDGNRRCVRNGWKRYLGN